MLMDECPSFAVCLGKPRGLFAIRVTRPCQPGHVSNDAPSTRRHRDAVLVAPLDVRLDIQVRTECTAVTGAAGRTMSSTLAEATTYATGHEVMALAHGHRCCEASASLEFAHGAAAYSACKFTHRGALMNGVKSLLGRFEYGRTWARRRVPGPLRGRCPAGPRGQSSPRTGDAVRQSHSMRDGVLGKRSARHSLEAA